MDQWHKVDLGTATQAHAPSLAVIAAVAQHLARNGDCPGLSVFSRHDREKNAVAVYFSPEAFEVAAQFKAAPCEMPSPGNNLGLLAGDSTFWTELRPA